MAIKNQPDRFMDCMKCFSDIFLSTAYVCINIESGNMKCYCVRYMTEKAKIQ